MVVVGFGGAGCAAAIAAHDAGARVLVLDKESASRAGGSTRVSGAVWFDNRDPERAAVYLRSLSAGRPVPEPVVEVWARETARNSEWMESLGIPVGLAVPAPAEFPDLEGSDVMCGWIGVEGRMGDGLLWAALSQAVRARDIDVRLETPARELITADGKVVGLLADAPDGSPLQVRATRGVILATGGFEANPEMVRDHLRLTDPVVWGTPAATGDGLRMAVEAGADRARTTASKSRRAGSGAPIPWPNSPRSCESIRMSCGTVSTATTPPAPPVLTTGSAAPHALSHR
ncbi:FAD-dependent oxidoreductase [Nocardia terrae]|uniref:FAD-dependent oxidoreductase n=1 Tax=Nocardia terrae TaxID=2675851 RepID=UPI002E25246A